MIPYIFVYFLFHFASAAKNSNGNILREIPKPVLKATTKIGVFNATFSWKIENIQLFDFGATHDAIHNLVGPTLTAIDQGNNNKIYTAIISISPEWIYHRKSYSEPRTYELSKYLIKCDFNIDPRNTEYQYISNGTIYNGESISKSEFNSLDSVEIIVKAFYSNESTHSIFLFSTPVFKSKPNTLGDDLLNLFKKDSESQFIIECAGEENLAYKPIMQARSSVFKELLLNGTDRVRVEDFEPKIVKKVIEFCNTDTIEDFEGEETNIFVMAFTYGIQGLLTYSSKKMVENAIIENAVTRFKFAHFYHEEPLKQWFFEYIVQNFVEVSKTPAFKSLDAELYKPILEELLKQKKIV